MEKVVDTLQSRTLPLTHELQLLFQILDSEQKGEIEVTSINLFLSKLGEGIHELSNRS